MEIIFLPKREMARLLGVHPDTLRNYRKLMIKGIHYICPNSRVVKYNRNLVMHWYLHCKEPDIHQKAIDAFLAAQPENQPLKPGRKSSKSVGYEDTNNA